MTAKQASFIEYYCNPGSDTYNNATQSMIKAGYSDNYCNRHVNQVVSNSVVKQAISEYKAKTTEKLDHDRQIAIDLLNQNILWLTPKAEQGDVQAISALTAAIRELNAISNLHKQTVFGGNVVETVKPEDKPVIDEACRIIKLKLA